MRRAQATGDASPEHDVRQAVRGVAATGTQLMVVRVLNLATFIVLARLLTPRDYGIAAAAGVFAAAGALLAAGGFSQAIVIADDLDEEDVDSVFWVSLGIGCVLSLLLVGSSWPVAELLDLPELTPVLWSLSPMFLAIALGSTHAGLLQRDFRFATLARIGVGSNLIATATGIALAFLGLGYWALIVQTLLVPVLGTSAMWAASDYRPRRVVARARFAEMFRTSRQFMGVEAMNFSYQQGDKLVVGHQLGAAVLGTYAVAYRFVFLLLEVVTKTIQLVALPSFSRLRSDPDRLLRAYATAARLAATISLPVFVVAGVCAESITVTLFGDQWISAVPAMQVFCAYGALHALVQFNFIFLQALGSARFVLRVSFAGVVLQLLAVVVAAPYGLGWAAASFVARALLTVPVVAWVLHRRHPGTPRRMAHAFLAPAFASLAAGAAGVAILHSSVAGSWWDLPVVATVCGFVYVGLMLAGGRRHVQDVQVAWRVLRSGTDENAPPVVEVAR